MDSTRYALDLLAAMPSALRAIIAAAPAEILISRPSAVSWSPQEVLEHLLRVEMGIGERVRFMLEHDNAVLEGPDDEPSNPRDPAIAFTRWSKARESNLGLLKQLRPEQLDIAGEHPRFGRLTIRDHVHEWAHHDLDHFAQILAALGSGFYDHIGGFQMVYPKPA